MGKNKSIQAAILAIGLLFSQQTEAKEDTPASQPVAENLSNIQEGVTGTLDRPANINEVLEFLGLEPENTKVAAEQLMKQAGLNEEEIREIQSHPQALDLNFILFFIGFGLLLSADVGVGLSFLKKEELKHKMLLLLSIPSFHFVLPLIAGLPVEMGLQSGNTLFKVLAYLLGAGGLTYLLRKQETEKMIDSRKDALIFSGSVSVDALASGGSIAIESCGKFLSANGIQALTVAVVTLGALIASHTELVQKITLKISTYTKNIDEEVLKTRVEEISEIIARTIFGGIATTATVKAIDTMADLPEINPILKTAIMLIAGYYLQTKLKR